MKIIANNNKLKEDFYKKYEINKDIRNKITYKEVIITLIDQSKQKYNNDLSNGKLLKIDNYINNELNIVIND